MELHAPNPKGLSLEKKNDLTKMMPFLSKEKQEFFKNIIDKKFKKFHNLCQKIKKKQFFHLNFQKL